MEHVLVPFRLFALNRVRVDPFQALIILYSQPFQSNRFFLRVFASKPLSSPFDVVLLSSNFSSLRVATNVDVGNNLGGSINKCKLSRKANAAGAKLLIQRPLASAMKSEVT